MTETTTKCEHANTEITLDDQIKCKDCGSILEFVEKKVATATSMRAAKALQEEIAVAGRYIASAFDDSFVVYLKIKGNIKEEVLCKKKGNRSFQIFKRLSVI